MKKFLTASAAATLGLALLAPVATAADYTIVFAGLASGAGTTSLGNPHASNYTVTSKFNQPRNVNGTNPHRGTDLGSSYGTQVNSVWNGWVVYASSTAHEVEIYLDINGNGVQDDNTYVKYDHLSSIYVSTGQWVTKGQKVAATGDEGGVYPAHLHFGVMRDGNADGRPDQWVRNEPYYRWSTYWDNGRMLDFTSLSTWSANKAAIYAYSHDETGKQPVDAGDVTIFHRKAGTSTWTATTATKNGDQFYVDFTGRYPAGTTIEWMARAIRSSIKSYSSMYWAFHNPKFAQPDFDPNATAYKYDYFTNTVQ
jgi:hypothetical protein